MFGAFKPSAPLSGGLLWKIPWRLSTPRKLRQRRRLRRVDNIVSVLDNALKRASASTLSSTAHKTLSANAQLPHHTPATGSASPAELSVTAEGQRLLAASQNSALEARRHGRGPRQGEMVPEHTPTSVQVPSGKLLVDEASESGTIKLIERWKAEMPTEQEMLPRDKYTMFDKKVRGYRKGGAQVAEVDAGVAEVESTGFLDEVGWIVYEWVASCMHWVGV